MSELNRSQLREAYELIKANRKPEATRILVSVLKQERDNADAWWLLANATDDPVRKRQALEQVLRVNPDHGAARRQLDHLGAGGIAASSMPVPEPPAPPPAPPSPFIGVDPFTTSESAADPFTTPIDADDDDPFGTPLGTLASRQVARDDDDPFGDPFSTPASRQIARDDDDPFGDPFSTPASRQVARDDDDPFGDLFNTPAARQTPRKAKNDDPFADPFAEDQPFTGAVERRKARPQQKRGASPFVIVLAVIGIITVIGCALVTITAIAGVSIFSTAVQTAMPELEVVLTQVGSGNVMGRVLDKGAISTGQTIRATLEDDGFTNHGYSLNGRAGQSVTIELNAVNNRFDTRLTLLGPDGTRVASNDDIDFQNNNRNSRIQTSLPKNGSYTVIVSDIGFGGGEYELAVR